MKLGLILIVINSLALGAEPVIPQPQKTPNLGISAPNGFSTWHREQGKKVVKFEGQSATLIPPNQYQIRNFQLTKVADDESIEYTVLAPDCSLNLLTKQASSPGVFKVTTANGLYSMEGEGFLWDSSTRRLVITNRLKTILNRDVFNLRTISPATPRKT